ncbi:MAG: glycosyltransferase family 4 protein [Verrucomicrobiota bacterium]
MPTRAAALALAFLRLLLLSRRERPDILHSHAAAADLTARLVCALLGLRPFVTAHSGYRWHLRRAVGMALERSMAFLTSQYFAVSSAVAVMLPEELGLPGSAEEISGRGSVDSRIWFRGSAAEEPCT